MHSLSNISYTNTSLEIRYIPMCLYRDILCTYIKKILSGNYQNYQNRILFSYKTLPVYPDATTSLFDQKTSANMKQLSTLQDKELVSLFKEGSKLAFEALYIRYRDRLTYFCKRLIKNEISSEDITQDIFLQLLESSDALNPELSFWGYLQTLARNRIIDEFKKFDVQSRFALHTILNGNDSTNQTENQIIDNDYTQLINKLIDGLSPRQKEIFQMSRVQGLTYKQIAEQMQISVETVREHIFLALKKIKKHVTQHADIHFK